jgi:hypothetical protein
VQLERKINASGVLLHTIISASTHLHLIASLTMSSFLDDFSSDDGSDSDGLLCWDNNDSDEDDCDSIAMICTMDDDDSVVEPVEVISVVTPIRPETPINFSTSKCEFFDSLIKKYPDFIPPARLPKLKKRSRPVCMFVNYMGTRHAAAVATPKQPVPVAVKKSVAFEPSPYPTDMPIYRPGKKQRMADFAACKAGRGNGPTPMEAPHEPSLGPTSYSKAGFVAQI